MGAVRGFASLKLPTLGREPATKQIYQQHAPFRTEGFIQLRRSWPAADKPLTTVLQIVRDHQLCFTRRADAVRRLAACRRAGVATSRGVLVQSPSDELPTMRRLGSWRRRVHAAGPQDRDAYTRPVRTRMTLLCPSAVPYPFARFLPPQSNIRTLKRGGGEKT